MTQLTLRNIAKAYAQGKNVISNLHLEVNRGEFLTLLGPSGCGKSTLLKIIAGLEAPSEGEILFDGRVVTHDAPAQRNVAMVFQSYALYPHLTVAGNLEYPLRKRGVPRLQRAKDVGRIAKTLKIEALLNRRPSQLSGGQQQRVALGRAMIRDPAVYLFDEPLSNLDASLRAHMRVELVGLHNSVGTTTIYVTHDQVEAMTMSSRIAVMEGGQIQQIGTPDNIYNEPINEFVARFVGAPMMNFVDASIRKNGASVELVNASKTLVFPKPSFGIDGAISPLNSNIRIGFRPEHLSIGTGPFRGRIEMIEVLGHETLVTVNVGSERLVVRTRSGLNFGRGEEVLLEIDYRKIMYFDVSTGKRVGFTSKNRSSLNENNTISQSSVI